MAAHVVTSDTSGVMENCIVRCIDIMKTEIRDCTLHYVEIQSSTIINNHQLQAVQLHDLQLVRQDF